MISGHFTVYHGITNILRVGDVSLFNTKTLQLIGIGELKTKKKNERELEISLILIGKRELNPFGKREIKVKQGNIENLADGFHDEERVKRQVRVMTKHFAKDRSKGGQHSYFDKYHFDDIDQLLKESKRYRVNFKKVSDGLIYAFVKAQHLFNKRFSDETPSVKRNFGEFRQSIKELTISNYELNSILHGSILYEKNGQPQIGIGIPPLFWSFLNMDSLKSLYFQECVLVTIFNPAYIFKRLEEKGFTVTTHNNVIIE